MIKVLVVALTTLIAATSFAKRSTDSQSWNSLAFKTTVNKLKITVETEARYSSNDAEIVEEHIKPYVGYKTALGEFGGVFSYLADDNFSKEIEKRYAFQYSKKILKNYYIDYSIRYRYELRHFKAQPKTAQRTRLRNQVNFKSLRVYKWVPFASSELNFYVNDTNKGPSGFSSHRSITGISRNFNKIKFSISYVNNYKVKNNDSNMKHSLGLALGFNI